ncbi:hypothetical protein [Ferroplasma acidarmanus]|uniref:Uncharacterized protein n=1 Tax=Ferroplasma acidarmanus Fer1 TaxID=333146 RepID=S0AR31_FERAC|nr:hypothetical protein [Ferroplasma acidarmanus]AGO61658.1 hypothetical protein FACI_IFERC00001G1678 [Ferroplasma acidarmanus Fer1]
MKIDKVVRIVGIIGIFIGIIIIIYGYYLHADAVYLNIFYKNHAFLTKSEIDSIKPGLYYGKIYMGIGFALMIVCAIIISISYKFKHLDRQIV